MKAIWTQPLASYKGDFIEFNNAEVFPKPFQKPHPPVWVGGWMKLAAKRAGIHTVLLPALNQKDLEELPPGVREAMHFELLETVDDVLEHGLETAPELEMLNPKVHAPEQTDLAAWQH